MDKIQIPIYLFLIIIIYCLCSFLSKFVIKYLNLSQSYQSEIVVDDVNVLNENT